MTGRITWTWRRAQRAAARWLALGAVLAASVVLCAAGPGANADPDTAAALAALRPLSPLEQAGVIQQMEQSRQAGELGAAQIPLLTGLIENASWTREHRRRVAFLLARLGEDASPALEELGAGEDATIRAIAADALRFQTLITQATAEERETRKRALQALPEFAAAHREAVEDVVAILATAYTRPDEPRQDVRIEALRGLARFGELAAPVLVQSLEQPDPFFYQWSKAALEAIAPAGEAALLNGLEHRSPLVRQRVIYVLIDVGLSDEAVAAIARLENDRDDSVRKAVARALEIHRRRSPRR